MKPSKKGDEAKLKELGVTGYVYPIDQVLGLTRLPFKMTVAAMLVIAKESTRSESYEEAEKILKERSQIETNDDTMRKVTNTIGKMVFENDIEISESAWEKFESGKLDFPKTKINNTLYLEIDGAMVPTRLDGKNGSIYKENKLCMSFSSDNIFWWTDKHGDRQHRIDKREYTSYIGGVEVFTKLVLSLALKNGYGKYKNTVLISDGATWIRNLKDIILPDAQQILNFYHLKEHITNYSKIIFNNDENIYTPWSKKVSDLFKTSDTDKAIGLIKRSRKNKYVSQLENLINYIQNSRNNIDYASYRSKGYFIGSGAIESSNKTVLQRRLKYGAMRWNVDSGQAVVTLVAKARSGLWESEVVQAAYNKYGEPMPHEFA
ncbi:MAG: hypothetical protein LBP92_12995 [Deltaproteobacteria bacterium]|nr:hypothetical protein [Deltaproteobacteria bacterium]